LKLSVFAPHGKGKKKSDVSFWLESWFSRAG